MKIRKITASARAAIRVHSATMDEEALRKISETAHIMFLEIIGSVARHFVKSSKLKRWQIVK